MQLLKSIIRHLKKGLLLPAFTLALFVVEAQTSTTPVARTGAGLSVREAQLAKAVEVQGTVVDAATKQPARAIRVTYQDFSAAITDSTGSFRLKVPNYNVAIMLEGEGYQVKEVALKGRRTVSTALYEESFNSFYDAANLPFSNQANNQVPYAATSLQTRGNWNRPSESPDAFLQGRVAGLNSIRRSGTPNIGANMYLRGISSLYTSNQPLVVIDGVIYDINDYGGSLISNNYTNPLGYIDIKDIDNITVIKDGSSTYGTKGANGVILITTARAKELATRIDFAVYGGVNFAPKNIPVLNAADYRTYLSDLLQSNGTTESQVRSYSYMNDDPSNPSYYRYHNDVDWQREVLHSSSLKNYYLKVTGGDNIAKYALSLGYLTDAGVTKETNINRYNTRFNADLNLSRRMTATANLSFTYNEQSLRDQGIAPKTNPLFNALIKSPLIRVNEVSNKGIASPDITDTDTFNVSNPVALINNMKEINKNYRFFGSIGFNYAFSKSVSLNNVTNVTVDKVRETMFVPRKGVVNDTAADGTIIDSRLGSQTKRILSLFNDTRLSYDHNFGRIHHVSARAGIRYLQTQTEQDLATGANSATDQLQSVGTGIAALRRTGGDMGKFRWLNTYFSADYSLSDKYYLSFNLAVDGSSRFGTKVADALTISGNSYAVMPSIAGAWLISSEKFMANTRFIDLLKLRASYGLTGNDDIGNYTSRQMYVSQNFLGTQGLVRSNFGNDQLQWERMQKLNVGLDAALFNERISLTLDAYQNNTDKMLVYEPLNAASGLRSALTNSGAMKTSGLEASLTARVVNKTALKWDVGFTIGQYKSTLTKLPGNELMTSYAGGTILSRVGNAPNVFYGYKTNGVYTSDAEAAASPTYVRGANGQLLAFKGGDMRFVNMVDNAGDTLANGSRIIVIDESDRQIIGNPNPKFFGSISTKVEWKRWSLEGLFTFTQGNDIYNYTRRQLESESNFYNQTQAVLNRWRNNGQVTNMPRASFGDPTGNARFSDRWIEDGSYFRLRTASLSYNLPLKAGFLRYSVLYVTANNLFTLTKYLGYDPEMSATTNVIGQGVDVTLEPQHRSVQVGVRFGL